MQRVWAASFTKLPASKWPREKTSYLELFFVSVKENWGEKKERTHKCKTINNIEVEIEDTRKKGQRNNMQSNYKREQRRTKAKKSERASANAQNEFPFSRANKWIRISVLRSSKAI